MWDKRLGARSAFALLILAMLAAAILARPPKWLSHFDQSFYLTIAYDLERHGVFSNGVLDDVDSTRGPPPPGMFFAPLYPWLVAAVARIDSRFAAAVSCSVEANHEARDGAECEVYAFPMHIVHAALLAVGVVAIALSAEIILASAPMFWLVGILATLMLLPDADLFSFLMTESLTFALYSLAALMLVAGLQMSRVSMLAGAGLLLGMLVLTRPSFLVLAPAAAGLIALHGLWLQETSRRGVATRVLAFAIAWSLVVGPWVIRNAFSVGRLGLTEEYGSAALIERFAYDDMSAREYALAFPYCLPGIGAPLVASLFGAEAMSRFDYDAPRSFFEMGRAHRERLLERHGRLDPLIGSLLAEEMRQRWWRYLLVAVPLAWCGAWVGGPAGLLLVPLFAVACILAIRRRPLFLIYAAPALVMLGLHAAVANHYTRYNLILIGPIAVGAAWMLARMHRRLRAPVPG
jgi:hypothetical protein